MSDIRTIVVCLLLCVTLALAAIVSYQRKTTAKIKADLVLVTDALASEKLLRSADVSSLTTRLQLAEKARTAKVKRDDATSKALAESPQWASERVPDAVLDAIGM